jgi:hypothetical protein
VPPQGGSDDAASGGAVVVRQPADASQPPAPADAASAPRSEAARDAGAPAPPDAAAPDAGRAPADAARAADATGVRYACTQIMGPNVTGEWFAAGFETLVDGNRWQVKAPHAALVDYWADPNHPVWLETGCQGTFTPCETRSRCAGNVPPDRIVFVVQTGNYLATPQAMWESLITAAMKTIKAKLPSVKHFELMTFVRGPGNASCGTETTISPNLDKAIDALAAGSAGAISAAPRFEVPMCSYFGGAPHFTDTGNKFVGNLIGKHYAQEP